MASNGVSSGKSMDYFNDTEEDIESGEIVVVGDRIAIAATRIKIGEEGALYATGVWELPKSKGVDILQGKNVYYSKGKIISKNESEAVLVGQAWKDSPSLDELVEVKIN